MDRQSLVLCRGTVPNAPFRERVELARATGFDGISLFASDYADARAGGLSDTDMRLILNDHGIEVAELDPLLRWIPEVHDTQQGLRDESEFYSIADGIGARSLNIAIGAPGEIPLEKIADAFAGVCRRANAVGLLVHLEFLPWSAVPNLEVALEVVQTAGAENGGVMFDTWHHARSGLPNASISALSAQNVIAIQINDAPAKPSPNLIEETMHHRRLPGDGEIDLVDILDRLRGGGCEAPLGIEVFNDELNALPSAEVAQRAGECARQFAGSAEVKSTS